MSPFEFFRVDIVICADCFFFTDVHESLARLIRSVLKCGGKLLSTAPSRSQTRDTFFSKLEKHGFQELQRVLHEDQLLQRCREAVEQHDRFQARWHRVLLALHEMHDKSLDM